MKLHVQADRYEFRLLHGETIIGHYNTAHGLLIGARSALRKDKTKSGQDLREWIEKGLAQEARGLAYLVDLAKTIRPLPSEDMGMTGPT